MDEAAAAEILRDHAFSPGRRSTLDSKDRCLDNNFHGGPALSNLTPRLIWPSILKESPRSSMGTARVGPHVDRLMTYIMDLYFGSQSACRLPKATWSAVPRQRPR
jgi:hypothetical protein